MFPIIFLYAHNFEKAAVAPRSLIIPTLVALGVTAGLFLGVRRLLGNSDKAAVSASVFVIVFFSFGHLSSYITSKSSSEGLLLVLLTIAYLILLFLLRKSRSQLSRSAPILNAIAASLLIMALVTLVPKVARAFEASRTLSLPQAPTLTAARKPDIYYLIFDRYAGNRTFNEVYGFDNQPFLDELTRKGFYAATESTSNYPVTMESLASSLNMTYLDFVASVEGENSADAVPLKRALWNASVIRSLKEAGYKFVVIGSWYEPTRHFDLADVNLKYATPSYFSWELLDTTVYRPLGNKFGLFEDRLNPRRVRYKTAVFQFRTIREAAAIPGPKFVFSHIVQPHNPYVFEADGSYLPEDEEARRDIPRKFLDQVVHTNARIREFVDTVITGDSQKDPVVILQADEGAHPFRLEADYPNFEWGEASDEEIRLKFPILNAYYLPGVSEPGLYPTITPVNSFRKIFNLYFGTGLGMLEDRNYVFQDFTRLYKFIDVTERVGFQTGE